MKANELRIGNIVIFLGHEEKICKVASLHSSIVFLQRNSKDEAINFNYQFGVPYENIKGIELTEKVLIKAGFELFSSNWYVKNGLYVINSFDVLCFKTGSWNTDKMTYVHQLQNLYFAITGEELEITI